MCLLSVWSQKLADSLRAGGPGTNKADLEWLDDKLKTFLADGNFP